MSPKRQKILSLSILLAAGAFSLRGESTSTTNPVAVVAGEPFFPTAESFKKYQCPEWFQDAKFGIWCHWGPDSVPGFNNYARDMWRQGSPEYKWHLEHIGHPSKAGYEAVIESWKAEKFDPDALMARFKAAGAKYFFALATHHDNFDNWDSTYHSWNSVNHGPHKDIVKLWRDAALKSGLRFGVSSHADLRGWCYMYGAQTSDTNGPLANVPYVGRNPALSELYNAPKSKYEAPPDEWQRKWLRRLTDLVDKYHPDFLYFDSGIPHGNYGMQLIAHYLNDSEARNGGKVDAVVNVKSGSFVPDLERCLPLTLQGQPFQAESSLSGWFYMVHESKNDPASNCKDTPWVIHTLADVVSKNGCFLINMPQRGDGSLYPECEQVLDDLAKWMPINGEAIFATRPWTTFGEGPTVLKTKGMNELAHSMTWRDVRYTRSKDGKTLYAIVCGLPPESLTLNSLAPIANRISSIELLGSDKPVSWKATSAGVVIQPASEWPCKYAITYKIKLKNGN